MSPWHSGAGSQETCFILVSPADFTTLPKQSCCIQYIMNAATLSIVALFLCFLYLWPTTIKWQESIYLMYFRRGTWCFKTICVPLQYNRKGERITERRLAKLLVTESHVPESLPSEREATTVFTKSFNHRFQWHGQSEWSPNSALQNTKA